MKMKKNINQYADIMLDKIQNCITDSIKGVPKLKSAIVHSVNANNTINITLPGDTKVYTNIQNQSVYQDLQPGDGIELLQKDGTFNNCWIIAKHQGGKITPLFTSEIIHNNIITSDVTPPTPPTPPTPAPSEGGNVVGPVDNVVPNSVVIFDGTSGKLIKSSNFTIKKSVPAGAKFTDTTYTDVIPNGASGLMSGTDKNKLDSINLFNNVITIENNSAKLLTEDAIADKMDIVPEAKRSHVTIFDEYGQVKDSGFILEKSVPADAKFTDTTYNSVTDSASGLMTSAQKKKLDRISDEANNYIHPISDNLTPGFYSKVKVNEYGHVIEANNPSTLDGYGIKDAKIDNNTVILGDKSITPITSHQDISGKADLNSPTFTGTPLVPTPNQDSNSTQIANTKFVTSAISHALSELSPVANTLRFKGFVGHYDQFKGLPTNHQLGDVYIVGTAGIVAGVEAEKGDMVICVNSRNDNENSDWRIIQANINNPVSGPKKSIKKNVAIFNDDSGLLIEDSGFTLEKSVPADAKFTDTTYNSVTDSASGLMTSTQKKKLDGIKIENNSISIDGVTLTPITSHQDISGKADLDSPAFTGIPLVPTPNQDNNSNQIANTKFVYSVVQNISKGSVFGPNSSEDNHVAVYNGETGNLLKDSGFTLGKSVPADAKFTDTQAKLVVNDGVLSLELTNV